MQLFALLLAALFAGSLWAWGSLWTRLRSGRPLLRLEPRAALPYGLVDLLVAFLVWTGCQVAGGQAVATYYSIKAGTKLEQLSPQAQGAFLLAGSLATVLAVVVSAAWLGARYGTAIGFSPSSKRQIAGDLRIGGIAFLLLAPIVYGIQFTLARWFESTHPLIELLTQNPGLPLLLVACVTALLVAPIAEEYFFRFLLQGWLQRVAVSRRGDGVLLWGGRSSHPVDSFDQDNAAETAAGANCEPAQESISAALSDQDNHFDTSNPYAAAASTGSASDSTSTRQAPPDLPSWPIFASAVLFALVHYSHGPAPIPLFLFALGLGYLFQRTNRLLPCIVLHFLLNACSMLMFVLSLPAA